jgi:hypothetical protein
MADNHTPAGSPQRGEDRPDPIVNFVPQTVTDKAISVSAVDKEIERKLEECFKVGYLYQAHVSLGDKIIFILRKIDPL